MGIYCVFFYRKLNCTITINSLLLEMSIHNWSLCKFPISTNHQAFDACSERMLAYVQYLLLLLFRNLTALQVVLQSIFVFVNCKSEFLISTAVVHRLSL